MRLPEWLKTNTFKGLRDTKRLLREHSVSTVCEEARCPNRGHCFSKPTATFLILGDVCTRNCSFCSVIQGNPLPADPDEPRRVALAAGKMGLRYVVITSVTRDDLDNGGASQFAATIRLVKQQIPFVKVEVLTPDFQNNIEAIKTVLDAEPDVFNHNLETVPRLYPEVRPEADYGRSLSVLEAASKVSGSSMIKSGLMVGLGETFEEVTSLMKDLRKVGCKMITIGQYLRPGRNNVAVKEFVSPDMFDLYGKTALSLGFRFVAAAPLVRSSMNAEELFCSSESTINLKKPFLH